VATEPGGSPLATVLDGLGGAPARAGVVHVVGVGRAGDDPATVTLRAAVLAASADHLAVAPAAATDLLRLARTDARVEALGPDPATALDRLAGDAAVVVLLPDDPTQWPETTALAEAARAAGREVEVVAGVGRTRAALAAAGIVAPPGHWLDRHPVTVVAAADPPLADLSRRLVDDGWTGPTRALLVERAGTTRQRVTATTVAALADHEPAGPVVVVVGTDRYVPWRDTLPLAGVAVLVPRATAQASRLSMRIRSLGGEPVEAPTITIGPGDDAALRAALRDLADGAYAAVCLTSPNGVDAVAAALDAAGLDARAFAEARLVACVGPGTADRLWERLHLRADLVPPRSTTEALADAVPAGHGRVLLPRADIATATLAEGLTAKGYEPVDVAAYATGRPGGLPPQVLRRLEHGGIDLVAFASSSTARNFAALVGDRPWRADVVSIGPVTSATCAEVGIPVAVEADPHDLDGLVDALCAAAARRRA
jgi:uroporphyrinogen III methyltransferase/synthase